jgi:hypothetical protein
MAKVAAMLAAQTSASFKSAELAMTSVDAMAAGAMAEQPTMSTNVAEGVGVTDGQVLLRDVRHLVRQGSVAPPTGFTKLGLPVLFFPAESDVVTVGRAGTFASVPESDLHLLFKYYLVSRL